MVWEGGSDLIVVPTRWALLGVALGGAPVWLSSGGVGFTEKRVVMRPPCYLPLGQLIVLECSPLHLINCTDFFIFSSPIYFLSF